MKFPAYFLEQLRDVLSPSQVIRKSVRLTQKSGGEFVGLCPFHAEKTPSFTVSDNKGFYHCFGCGAHGDIVKFTMETRNLPFAEAVKELAQEAGLQMPLITKEDVIREKKIADIYEVMETACQFFESQLHQDSGKEARSYIKKRNLTPEQEKKFRLGFAPDSYQVLKNHMAAKNIPEKMLEAAGLVGKGETGEVYARFRNRLIFPITDSKGRVIAFGGRSLAEQMPKYLNSPETEIFKKGHNLYNLKNAVEAVRKGQKLILVEGYMDVIAMDGSGFEGSVAPLGTAVTENQLLKIWQITPEPVIALDGDKAGMRAMAKVAENFLGLLQPGTSLSFIILPENMDPDDALKAKGEEFMRNLLKNPVPLSELLWQIETSSMDGKTPEKLAALEKRLFALAERLKDRTLKSNYQKFFKNKLFEYGRAVPQNLSQNNKKFNLKKLFKRTEAIENTIFSEVSELKTVELLILKFVISCPEILQDQVMEEEFSCLEFSEPKLDKLRDAVLEHTALELTPNSEGLVEALEKSGENPQIFFSKGELRQIDADAAKYGFRYAVARYNHLRIKQLITKEKDPELQYQLQQQEKDLSKVSLIEQEKYLSHMGIFE